MFSENPLQLCRVSRWPSGNFTYHQNNLFSPPSPVTPQGLVFISTMKSWEQYTFHEKVLSWQNLWALNITRGWSMVGTRGLSQVDGVSVSTLHRLCVLPCRMHIQEKVSTSFKYLWQTKEQIQRPFLPLMFYDCPFTEMIIYKLLLIKHLPKQKYFSGPFL